MILRIPRRHLIALIAAVPIAFSALPVKAQDSKTLTVGIVSDPVTLDPALMASFFDICSNNLDEPCPAPRRYRISWDWASVETPDSLHRSFPRRSRSDLP